MEKDSCRWYCIMQWAGKSCRERESNMQLSLCYMPPFIWIYIYALDYFEMKNFLIKKAKNERNMIIMKIFQLVDALPKALTLSKWVSSRSVQSKAYFGSSAGGGRRENKKGQKKQLSNSWCNDNEVDNSRGFLWDSLSSLNFVPFSH